MYIYQLKEFPDFEWDKSLSSKLGNVRHLQGRLVGKLEGMGFNLQGEAGLNTLVQNVVESSAIEDVKLDVAQVRSSLAMRLGMDKSGVPIRDRKIEGVVEMMLDATLNHKKEMNQERLWSWHSYLFPDGWGSGKRVKIGHWREGSMQVVSGAIGKEKVHYEAPVAKQVKSMMQTFIEWFNQENSIDLVLKAGIAHLWFVTIHPFGDGNGRITRALTDMLLAQSDKATQRFYSMPSQIFNERKSYYDILEQTQKQTTLNITPWLEWFLDCLSRSIETSEETLSHVLFKFKFWNTYDSQVNDRQRKFINKVMDNWNGNITSEKYRKINKVSQPTAFRDIQDLMKKRILLKGPHGGRSTNYQLTGMPD